MSKKTELLTALDETIKVVFIQVRLSRRAIPDLLYKMAQSASRTENNNGLVQNGAIAIAPMEHTDVSDFSEALCKKAGFVLVDVTARPHDYNYVVRFVFSRDPAQVAAVSEKKRMLLDGAVRREMVMLLGEAVYNAMVYRNPSVYDGKVIKGRNHFSVNLNARCVDNVSTGGKLTVKEGQIAIVSPEEEQ